jgi:hypothetical protein
MAAQDRMHSALKMGEPYYFYLRYLDAPPEVKEKVCWALARLEQEWKDNTPEED